MSLDDLRYPFRWSEHVVDAFLKTNARATTNFANIAQLSEEQLRFYLVVILAKGKSADWELIKGEIKAAEPFEDYEIDKLDERYGKALNKLLVVTSGLVEKP